MQMKCNMNKKLSISSLLGNLNICKYILAGNVCRKYFVS